MIALRTMEGLDIEKVKQRFGDSYAKTILANAKRYINDKKLVTRNSKLILTKEGKFFADGIAAGLFF